MTQKIQTQEEVNNKRKVSIKDSYNYYKKNQQAGVISKKYFMKIVSEYNQFLIDKVIDGETVSLPSGFGCLFVRGRIPKIYTDKNGKLRGYATDWKKTLSINKDKIEKTVFHTNDHTDGVMYKYIWMKYHVNIDTKALYTLRMSRTNKRRLAQCIKNGKEYFTK